MLLEHGGSMCFALPAVFIYLDLLLPLPRVTNYNLSLSSDSNKYFWAQGSIVFALGIAKTYLRLQSAKKGSAGSLFV